MAHIVGQMLLQASRRLPPIRLIRKPTAKSEWELEAARAYERLGIIYLLEADPTLIFIATLRMLNLSESVGESPELARAYANMCVAVGLIPLHSVAESYAQRAWDVASRVNQLSALGWVREITSVYKAGLGKWSEVRSSLSQAIEIFDQLGDKRRWIESTCLLSTVMHYQGDFINRLSLGESVYRAACQTEDVQARAWGMLDQAESLLPLGRFQDALKLINQAIKLVPMNIGRAEEVWAYGLLAKTYLRLGEQGRALEIAKKALKLASKLMPATVYTMEGYAGIAEVFLLVWETDIQRPTVKHQGLPKASRQACVVLRKFARVMPIGQPRARLCQGLYYCLAGNKVRALNEWHASLGAAKRLAMPYEEALAHFELGRHLDTEDPEQRAHLTLAREMFASLNATFDLDRAKAVLKL